ncbi:MAG: Processive diacylglycerol beta-glucosyltransferase [Pelotomaculum sp. PtaB.Bin013]|uniref:Glycosyltransferase n=1 Tax=Pelotomaculum isophthalicicum JI TaxID=947010 RepID=A0A9X4H0H2_9FIRM|nr:glycosyltransferase [Pelotomaculum isophthalicicum]MDF9407281.1 glycosyltransferase [Pelotomaculum isophthalicicum JI]OPX91955.1 MAG: Processive diacylglycerol beta-glucosyltransferase [Pelotomaculum sp. PtaB.Bin013]
MLNKILILSVTVGNGHMRAAEAIKKAAGNLYPEIEVSILDTFRYASPFLEKVILGTYMEILKMSPVIYGYLYRQAEKGQPLSGRGKLEFNRILNLLVAPRLVKYIKDFQPEVIVCTHPFPVGIMSYMKKKGIFKGPVFATITDFTIHSFWIFPGVDYYLIGAEQLQPECAAFGIKPDNARATGIPIDPAFERRYDKKEVRKKLGLNPELPAILITGGGLGMGHLESTVKELGESIGDCQLMVVAGTNASLRDRLLNIAPDLSCAVKIYGYVNNIHELMAAADLLIGKPGGLSCAEAMAIGLPVFIIDPLPGQEERNAQFLAGAGAGVRVDERNMAGQVKAYLTDSGRLGLMTRAAAALGKPKSARNAVLIMEKAVAGVSSLTR